SLQHVGKGEIGDEPAFAHEQRPIFQPLDGATDGFAVAHAFPRRDGTKRSIRRERMTTCWAMAAGNSKHTPPPVAERLTAALLVRNWLPRLISAPRRSPRDRSPAGGRKRCRPPRVRIRRPASSRSSPDRY